MDRPSLSFSTAILFLSAAAMAMSGESTQWCIARSGASLTALQTALDYACGAGVADCLPIQPNGLCYLPNSLAAHASYAFNSFYQRSGAAAGSCDFAGTATVSVTDPSYGSCTYPSSVSTAGSSATPNSNTPMTSSPAGPGFGNGGGLTPDLGTPLSDTDDSSSESISIYQLVSTCCFLLQILLSAV